MRERMAALLLLAPALGTRGCAHVTLPLSSLHPSTQQKNSAQKAGRSLEGWRGVLDLGWQRRSRIPPAPPFPARRSHPAGCCCPVVLTRMSMCCLVVARGLAGGCHIAQIQTVPGVGRRHWDRPWELFVSSQQGDSSAPVWHLPGMGKRRLCLL